MAADLDIGIAVMYKDDRSARHFQAINSFMDDGFLHIIQDDQNKVIISCDVIEEIEVTSYSGDLPSNKGARANG